MKKNGTAPVEMWKMPNNFKKREADKGEWGKWIAQYEGWRDIYDPNKPDVAPIRNIYSFIRQQIILDKENAC